MVLGEAYTSPGLSRRPSWGERAFSSECLNRHKARGKRKITSRGEFIRMAFIYWKRDLCPFHHIWLYWIFSLSRAFCVCLEPPDKVKYNPCPQCAYIWCVFLCAVCTRFYTLYVCACISMPVGVCVSVRVCICSEHNWGTLWLAALGNTVHRGSPCWQEGIWKSYTDKPTFVLGLDRKGASVSRNRGEGISLEKERNTWEKAERGIVQACASRSCEWGRGTKGEGPT